MSGFVSIARRALSVMASEYIAGTHSMAFVTVPNEDVARKLARYGIFLLDVTMNCVI